MIPQSDTDTASARILLANRRAFTVMHLESHNSSARWPRIAAASLAVIVIAALVVLALSRERGSVLDGRWELVLVELPTDSVQPANTSWIEFQDGKFQGIGDCSSFHGEVEASGKQRVAVLDMAAEAQCTPLSAVDNAYNEEFSTVATYSLSDGGFLTLQSSDASVQFSYEWAP